MCFDDCCDHALDVLFGGLAKWELAEPTPSHFTTQNNNVQNPNHINNIRVMNMFVTVTIQFWVGQGVMDGWVRPPSDLTPQGGWLGVHHPALMIIPRRLPSSFGGRVFLWFGVRIYSMHK